MSSSSSNHRAGGQGRGTARRRRTNISLTYTLNCLTVSFSLATLPRDALQNLVVVFSFRSCPVHGSDSEQKIVEAFGKKRIPKVIRD